MAAFELLGGGFLAAFQFWAFMTIVTGLLVGVVAGVPVAVLVTCRRLRLGW